jgi:hypothetical protein hcinC1_06020
MSFLENNRKVFLVLFTIYFIINIPLLINFNGIYWDDWTLVGHSLDTLNRTFFEAVGYAGYFVSYIHYYMINVLGVYSYRISTFILLFSNVYFVFRILCTISVFSYKDRFFITLFFMIAPLYSAKVALINFPYTLFSTIFFFAFFILSVLLNNLRHFKRILILLLFFVSFLVNSLLVFYIIVLIYIFYKKYNYQMCFLKNISYFIKNNFDFILLPVLFFIIKSIWFLPSGAHGSDYNRISIYAILNPKAYIESFATSFLEPFLATLNTISYITVIFILFSVVWACVSKKIYISDYACANKNNIALMILGVLIFAFGAMPYIAVGKMPASEDWSSRFQLLLPLGFAMVLYYGLGFLFKIKVYAYVIVYLVLAFCCTHIVEQARYNIDWFYQQSIIENYKSNKDIKNHTTFFLKSRIQNKFAKNRLLRFYEINGMSKLAFGDDKRLFMYNQNELELYGNKYIAFNEYNFSSWIQEDAVVVYLKSNEKFEASSEKNKLKTFLRLKYYELFDKENFKNLIKDLVTIEVKHARCD